jgi:hypothetical protein
MNQETGSASKQQAHRILKWGLIALLLIVFVPLILDSRFRKFVAVSLLGIFYSCFMINTWERWTSSFQRNSWSFLDRMTQSTGRAFLWLFPFKAWGMVPFLIEVILLLSLFIFGWFLAPLFYEIIHNPSTLGWIRDLLQRSSPEFYQFLGDLTYAADPYQVIRENAQQIFTSLNRFFSSFVLPLNFILFTAIGAMVHDSLESLLRRIEDESRSRSRILDDYSRLFEEYLTLNTIYYVILGTIGGAILFGLDLYQFTQFGWKIIIGLIITFALGNLLVPGLGTLATTALIVGMLYLWQGLVGALVAGGFFMVYFMVDDYLIKPSFLLWLGQRPDREWEFGVEIIVFWLVILYASFGLVGTLLLFPGLCFLDAYLQHQYPGWRTLILSPLKSLAENE